MQIVIGVIGRGGGGMNEGKTLWMGSFDEKHRTMNWFWDFCLNVGYGTMERYLW